MVITQTINKGIALLLRKGGVGVLPTDTVYGIVGSAFKKETVERIYRLRKRNPKKPMIVLIASVADLKKFGVKIDSNTKRLLSAKGGSASGGRKLWPGKISVIFPLVKNQKSKVKSLKYLHRGTKTLAFRLPRLAALRKLLRSVGPLVAPSANWEGKRPARTIREAKKYFANKADFYIDGGKLKSLPSTLVSIRNGRIIVLRKGAGRVHK